MKKTLLFIFSLLTLSLWAQDGINYQGAATDANGDELTNQNITIRASVLSTSASGNLEWEETHSATTDQFGLFNVVIGQGTNTTNGATATFDDMDWGSGNHFLKIEMDATGGTNYAMIGTTQMMSVPYALYAKSAGIDSAMLANMIASSGGGSSCDIELPAGLDGDPITHDLYNSAYTVPSGKMLYILDFHNLGDYLHIDGLKFNNIIANKARICNSGQVVSGGGNFNGLLVDEISDVIGITHSLGNYTVPSAKMLYILDFRYYNGDLSIDGIVLTNDARIKIAKGGQVISGGGNLNGYLVNENYFAGCGGGSSSANTSSTTPAGMIQIFAGATSPSGWLLCDGSEVSRSAYSDLFNVIGITYGQGDGSTTFNLPDLRGRVPVGKDDMGGNAANVVGGADTLGNSGGEETHILTVDEMPSHSHAIGGDPYTPGGGSYYYMNTNNAYSVSRYSSSEGGDQPHNNMPPYIVMHYIIKY